MSYEYIDWQNCDNIVEQTNLNKLERYNKKHSNFNEEEKNIIEIMFQNIENLILIQQEQKVIIQGILQTLQKLKEQLNNIFSSYKNKTLFTFMDDDAPEEFLTTVYPIYEKYGIKASLSIPVDMIDLKGSMTTEQLQELNSEGYDLLNHIKGGYTLSPENSPGLITRCKQYMIDKKLLIPGTITEQILVYPNANTDPNPSKVEEVCSKFVSYALNVGEGNMQLSSLKKLNISRMYLCKSTGIGTWQEDEVMNSLGYKKVWKDYFDSEGNWTGGEMVWEYEENKEKGWCILFQHCWMKDEVKYGDNIFVPDKLDEFINYVKSKKIKIVTVTQALLIYFGIPDIKLSL
ncbi:hypothetical protein [Clostridium sp. BJN0001]|uniref:hypothetical protein n=1 Tax=Clostridium sp. BJN0001 TaxID=2930219 RepID=UPI001FD27796|nr:hypothetical protein [Clostridium sp. BJN0001]